MLSIKVAYPADVGLTLRFTPYNIRSVIANLIFSLRPSRREQEAR